MTVEEIVTEIRRSRLTRREKTALRRAVREAETRYLPNPVRGGGGRPRSLTCGTCGLAKAGSNAEPYKRTYQTASGAVTGTYVNCRNCRRGTNWCQCGHQARQHREGECWHTTADGLNFDCECIQFRAWRVPPSPIESPQQQMEDQ